jgi:predicted O-methyltransferase YrrM
VYYDAVFPKLRKGGFMLVDNTLWDGKVLQEVDEKDNQTEAIRKFNDYVAADSRVEKLILPLRDGLTLIRIK